MWRPWRSPRTGRSDEDFGAEIRAHIALETERLIAEGADPDDARAAAHRAFGNVTRARERFHESRRIAWLGDLARDASYALRTFAKHPGFTLAAVATLAIGIGATTAIFSVVHTVLQRVPYKDADRFVRIAEDAPRGSSRESGLRPVGVNVSEIGMLRTSSRTLSHVGFYLPMSATLNGTDHAVRLNGIRLSPDILAMFGVQPLIGRLLEPREAAPWVDRVVVMSHTAWQRHLGGDPGVIGRAVSLDGAQHTVVGVMPPAFTFPDTDAQFWIPAAFPAQAMLIVTGRLQDGATLDAATDEVNALIRKVRMPWLALGIPRPPPPPPPPPPGVALPNGGLLPKPLAQPAAKGAADPLQSVPRFRVIGLQAYFLAAARPLLLIFSVAVTCVLLIACVNVAILQLARAASRQREFDIRISIGAGRGRLIRQCLTESAMLGVAGGALGVGLAYACIRLMRSIGAGLPGAAFGPAFRPPQWSEVGLDPSVLAFAVAVSLIAGIAAGVLPALRQTRGDRDHLLRDAHGSPVELTGGRRTGDLLIAAEVSLAMLLFISGGLLIHSFVKLSNVHPGYDPAHVLTFQVVLPSDRPAAPFRDDLIERLQSLPGVAAAAYADHLPMRRFGGTFVALRTTPALPPGPPPPPGPDGLNRPEFPYQRIVSRDFLKVMGIRVLEGRGFLDSDRPGQPQALLINRTLARSGLLGPNPVGTQIYAAGDEPWQVVGIVDDVRQFGLDRNAGPQVLVAYSQLPSQGPAAAAPYYAVRSDLPPEALVPAVRAIVQQIDPRATLDRVATMEQAAAETTVRQRFNAVLFGLFAGVAALLAAIGIYGVTAYAVRQRTREIGIRMALGARRSEVLALVLRQGLRLAAGGVILGVAAAAATTRFLSDMLFGISPLDPATFGIVSAVFVAVAALASYVPARRATKVDPLVALRFE